MRQRRTNSRSGEVIRQLFEPRTRSSLCCATTRSDSTAAIRARSADSATTRPSNCASRPSASRSCRCASPAAASSWASRWRVRLRSHSDLTCFRAAVLSREERIRHGEDLVTGSKSLQRVPQLRLQDSEVAAMLPWIDPVSMQALIHDLGRGRRVQPCGVTFGEAFGRGSYQPTRGLRRAKQQLVRGYRDRVAGKVPEHGSHVQLPGSQGERDGHLLASIEGRGDFHGVANRRSGWRRSPITGSQSGSITPMRGSLSARGAPSASSSRVSTRTLSLATAQPLAARCCSSGGGANHVASSSCKISSFVR